MTETTKEPKKDTAPWPRRLFVCAGWFRAHDSPTVLFLEMFPLDELEQIKRDGVMIFEASRLSRALRLGGVYSIEATDEMIRPRTAQFIRAWDHAEEVAGWRLRENAARAAVKMAKEEKAITSWQAQLEILAPLRKTYMRSGSLMRRALEIAVLAYLRGDQS